MEKKIIGNNCHRHSSNPKEKEFHDKFINRFFNDRYNHQVLNKIIFGTTDGSQINPKDNLSERENIICVTLAQWFGSPVGQGFLRDCGFEPIKKQNVEEI